MSYTVANLFRPVPGIRRGRDEIDYLNSLAAVPARWRGEFSAGSSARIVPAMVLGSCVMALGAFTKQLAQQAIGESVKDLLDSSRSAEPASAAETYRSGDSLGAVVAGQVQAMQKALKDTDELVVLFNSGAETIRVLEFYSPARNLLVLTGVDAQKNLTRVISPAESLQLVCKVMKVQEPAKPVRINFISPRAKSD